MYFMYHIFAGDHGISAEARLDKELYEAHKRLSQLERTQCSYEKKIKQLRPESLNKDLLEQRVREVLAYSNPNEVIFVHPE